METVIQIAFGIKVDSLEEPKHPFIVNVKNFISRDLPKKENLFILIDFMFPSIAYKMGIRVFANMFGFFRKVALEIANEKRKEFNQNKIKNANYKGSNLIEMMFEAELDLNKANIDIEKPKQNKCEFIKLIFLNQRKIQLYVFDLKHQTI